ncbi:MAG TPA: lytic murein transglycosylase B [Oceanospirillales bacterium]|nr:lytic murein transglycosylase B [Oceanospirillales bacterium]
MKKIVILLLLTNFFAVAKEKINPLAAFAKKVATENKLDEKAISKLLTQAKKKQSIIDAMNRPAEKKKPWYEYRAIFLKEKRIKAGVEFWQKHKKTLDAVSKETGVPSEIIVAIIGVETNYGGNMGSYRVLDALFTLAFHYPKRSKFFTAELEKFFVLTTKENISATETLGSYAGAMGYGQFMPSSYLMYAVDYDKDGKRDLLNNIDDAIASVANYFKAHGWKKDQGIAYLAQTTKKFTKLAKQNLKPSKTVKQLKALGYVTKQKLSDNEVISLTQLQQEKGMEYWFALQNFYVITRYNHSEMYAMAVFQLANEINNLKQKLTIKSQ